MKIAKHRPYVAKSWSENSRRAHDGTWTHEVEASLTGLAAPRFFRIHVAGDFFSRNYAKQWAEIARRHPETRFLAFTKAWANIKGIRWPDNVTIVCSAWPGMTAKDIPKGKPIAFAGKPEQYNGALRKRAENAIECPGGCEQCGMCWELGRIGRDVRFAFH